MPSDPNKKNHWSQLASKLGADVPAELEPCEPESTNLELPAEPSPPMPAEKKTTRREPQAPTNWNNLAGELGIEVDGSQHTDPPATDDSPVDTLDTSKEPPAESQPTFNDDAAISPVEEQPTPLTDISDSKDPSESPKKFSTGDIPSFTFNDVPTVEEMNDVLEKANVKDIRPHSHETAFDLSIFDEEDTTAASVPQSSSSSEEEQKETTETGTRPRRRRGRRSRRPADSDNHSTSEAQFDSDSEEQSSTNQTQSGSETKSENRSGNQDEARSGRRRRHRRGRKTEQTSQNSASPDIPTEKIGFTEEDYELFDDTESTADNAPSIATTDNDQLNPVEESPSRKRTPHRKISSWSETIGIVIDTNISTRHKSDKPGSRGRGHGQRGSERK